MADKYAVHMRTMIMTSFFIPFMPIVILFSLLGTVLNYWADKVIMEG